MSVKRVENRPRLFCKMFLSLVTRKSWVRGLWFALLFVLLFGGYSYPAYCFYSQIGQYSAEELAQLAEESFEEDAELVYIAEQPTGPFSWFFRLFDQPAESEVVFLRGQSGDYWGAVQQDYNSATSIAPGLSTLSAQQISGETSTSMYGSSPVGTPQYTTSSSLYTTPTFVAQTASTQPTLNTPVSSTPTTSSSAPIVSGSSVAPPLIDVNTATLQPAPSTIQAAPAGQTFFNEPVATMKRFWEACSFNYTYIPKSKNASNALGNHEFDLAGRFAFPCKCLPHSNDSNASGYWFVAPSLKIDLWSPVSQKKQNTYELGLGFGAQPQFTPTFGGDLFVQVGMASVCKKFNSKGFFVRGRGLARVAVNEYVQAIGGIVYYGRNRFKMLPSFGVAWKPNEQNLWYLVFPNPQLSHFIGKSNETDWWGYVAGDIGGGRWCVKRQDGGSDKLDYNDYQVGVGLKFKCATGFSGKFEVGGAFGRELYAHKQSLKAKSEIYLSAGVMY